MGSSGTASAAVSACTRSSSRSPTSRNSSRRCSTASSRAWTSAPARAAAPSWSARKVNARIELGARRASSRPFEAPGFLGSVERGASCNCETLTLIPHCNGTHTECVGHLTREPLDAHRVIPTGLLPAVLLSVDAEPAPAEGEDTEPAPERGDRLITARALERAWPAAAPFEPQALLIRTLPNTAGKLTRDYSMEAPPYLTQQAAQLLVRRGIWHLIVDVPSIDRTHDEGRL